MNCILLEKAVPMDSSSFVEVILDSDLNPITPIGFDGRARESTVDNQHLMS